jgi:cytochrome c oxidase subunit 2
VAKRKAKNTKLKEFSMEKISELLYMLFGFSLPEQASKQAHLVDDLYSVVMIISILGFVGLMSAMVFFVVRYHRSNNEKSAYIPHNTLAETIWTVIPTIIFLGIGVWGLVAYFKMNEIPDDAYKIKVTAKQWMWEFTYDKDGKEASATDVMYVPIDTPIVLDMYSVDVLHSFYVPSFRVKRDIVPGMRTQITFTASKLGDFRLYCAEFCGTSHSKMRGTVRVVSKERFNRWINFEIKEANITDPIELGSRLFQRKGCTSCHSIDGSTIVGPSLKGVFGKETILEDGSKVLADAKYIRESILKPQAKIVQGFTGTKMNSFAGQLDEKEIDYLIKYLETVK